MSPDLPSTPPDALPEAPSSPLASSPTEAPQTSQKVTEDHTSPNTIARPDVSPATPLSPQPSPLSPSLSDRQLAAIPLVLAGLTDTDIASQLGLARETVNRWRHHNPDFIARLNLERHLRHAATADRYDRLLNQAMDVIDRYTNSTNYTLTDKMKLSTSLLRLAGRHALAATPGPTNPSDILQSLLSQGLPPDTTPDNDPPTPQAAGGHEGCTRVARG